MVIKVPDAPGGDEQAAAPAPPKPPPVASTVEPRQQFAAPKKANPHYKDRKSVV